MYEETIAGMAQDVLPPPPMTSVPQVGVPPTPTPDYRRERTLLIVGLSVAGLLIAAGGGIALGSTLAHRATATGPSLAALPAGDSGLLPAFTPSAVQGPEIHFDPSLFPKEAFRHTEPVADTSTEATADETGDVIHESGDGAPIDLLGGDSETPTGEGEGAPDIFFGQDPPSDTPSGGTNLFDLGADEADGNAAPAPTAATTQRFSLSLGSFSSRSNADLLVKQLLGYGVNASVSETTRDDGTVLFRVYGGTYDSRESGQQQVDMLRGHGIDAWLVGR